jgi:hypothetical protein
MKKVVLDADVIIHFTKGEYCNHYGIIYLTTNDFLFYGIQRGLFTQEEAASFIVNVRKKGSYPPIVDFKTYRCTKI